MSNLGGTFPRFFVLKFVDMFTAATCTPPVTPPSDLSGHLIGQTFSCALEAEKHRCIEGGGSCDITRDGKSLLHLAIGPRKLTSSRVLHREHPLHRDRHCDILGLY